MRGLRHFEKQQLSGAVRFHARNLAARNKGWPVFF